MGCRLAGLMAAGLVASNIAMADDMPEWGAETLSGDWGGVRSSLYERGLDIGLTHKSDLLANVSGGVSRGGVVLMNSEVALGLDMDKLTGWSGGSTFIQYHVQHGNQSINNYVGSFAGVDNIETGTSTGQLYQAWLQHNWADDSLSLLAGLYAIDSEFYVTDTSGLFLQPPYGMSAEMAQAGRNGPPVFPMGALALRFKYVSPGFYAQAALTDGVPGNPNDAHGTQIRLDKGDGTLAVAEIGLAPAVEDGRYDKTAIGLWRYSARASDLVDLDVFGNPVQRVDQGFYVLAERTLQAEEGQSGQGLSGFLRFGTVNKDAYQADWSASLGLNYQGLFDGRDDDAAGIAVTASPAGTKYRLSQSILGNITDSYETVVELTYRAQLQPWLAIQPSLQRIFNPNMDAAIRDAWAAGVRLEVSL
jgi:porin